MGGAIRTPGPSRQVFDSFGSSDKLVSTEQMNYVGLFKSMQVCAGLQHLAELFQLGQHANFVSDTLRQR